MLPQTQRAVLFNTKTNALAFSPSHALPSNPSALLVRVHSTAICNGELTWARFLDWPDEQVPCYDVSGTVVALPSTRTESASAFQVGDKIHARIPAERPGAAADYALILPGEAAKVPEGLDMQAAATLPLSAHTAWQAVFEHGLLTGSFTPTAVPHVDEKGELVAGQAAGKRVLVLGAAGAVGGLAVQFAKLAGAVVVGTASKTNEELVRGLGADEVVDYITSSVEAYVASGKEKFDLVFDCVGGDGMLDGWHGVANSGIYVSVTPGFKEPEGGKPEGTRSKWFIMQARGEELAGIGALVGKGGVKAPRVDSVWRLEEFKEAFGKAGRAKGKVVFRVLGEE